VQGNRSGKTVMSHAHRADKLLIQANSGRQTGAALPLGQII
jgi:hypothetical protein